MALANGGAAAAALIPKAKAPFQGNATGPITVAPPAGSPGFNAGLAAGVKRPLDQTGPVAVPPPLRPKIPAPSTVAAQAAAMAEAPTVSKAAAMCAAQSMLKASAKAPITVAPPTR